MGSRLDAALKADTLKPGADCSHAGFPIDCQLHQVGEAEERPYIAPRRTSFE